MDESDTAESQQWAGWLLQATGISKSFPGVRALIDVDLQLQPGEVLAVVGENGAGKSTLMKILAGVEQADEGGMQLAGQPFAPRSTHDAIANGVALIHQELNLAGNLDIAANICLGCEPHRLGWLDQRAMRITAHKALRAVGLHEPVDRRVDELSIGHRQLVEIAKALSIDTRVLIMDEPTSSLSLAETDQLFEVVHELKSSGVAVIYISHRLAEVEEIADRVLVLRDGRISGKLQRAEINRQSIVQLMVGREVVDGNRRRSTEAGQTRLSVSDLQTTRHPGSRVNLEVRAGEIVGLAGLVGAGRTEVLEAIFGITQAIGGVVRVDGQAVSIACPGDAVDAGLALVPEDRQLHGLIVETTVRRNLGLAELARRATRGFVNRTHERSASKLNCDRLLIRATTDQQIAGTLSGGNQQKVVMGKWLTLDPQVLLLDEPTRGVDVGARAEIYDIMEQMAANGSAILFASSDLEEVIAMSDRVLVMHDGHIEGELTRCELTEEAVMRLATGVEEAA